MSQRCPVKCFYDSDRSIHNNIQVQLLFCEFCLRGGMHYILEEVQLGCAVC